MNTAGTRRWHNNEPRGLSQLLASLCSCLLLIFATLPGKRLSQKVFLVALMIAVYKQCYSVPFKTHFRTENAYIQELYWYKMISLYYL